MRYKRIAVALLASTLLFGGCAQKREQAQEMLAQQAEENRHDMTTFAMDTVMQFTIYSPEGDALFTKAEQEIRRLERLLSVTMADSEISRLNANAGVAAVSVSADTMELLRRGRELGEWTNYAYNIAVAPFVQAWGFTTDGEQRVPEKETLEAIFPLTNAADLLLDEAGGTAMLQKPGMAVDLGGIAKGYTSDRVAALLREDGVTSGLIYLGGNIAVIGTKPNGDKWKTAVGNPLDSQDYVGILEVADCSVITAGGYQRYFEQDGKRYHHIIDPKTGSPAESGLLSVTIISQDGAKADALSTALFVMGLEDALQLWRENDDFDAIFVTEDGRVIATEGAAEIFTFEGRDNDFVYETVEK